MKHIRFNWSDNKNQTNIKKHKIDFNEAKSCFYDPNAKVIFDPDNSSSEERFILLGISSKLNILIICHCYREDDEVIRVISARKANKQEIKQYGGN